MDSNDFKKSDEKFMEKEQYDDKQEFKFITITEKKPIIEIQSHEKVKVVVEVTVPLHSEKESKLEMKKDEDQEKIAEHLQKFEESDLKVD